MSPESTDSMSILRVSLNDPMCVPSLKMLLCLNEASEWGCRATLPGTGLVEGRFMGHTMVPLNQCYVDGLEHDCSTWDQLYEDNKHFNFMRTPFGSLIHNVSLRNVKAQGRLEATVDSPPPSVEKCDSDPVIQGNIKVWFKAFMVAELLA